jgi:DNA end-binding protein Ku
MRSIWKGHIRFSLVTIPIRIYSAIEPSETIRFNQVHRSCNGPVGYDKRCKKCHQILTTQDIVKGYQHEPDRYVILEPDDLAKVRLPSTRVIDIEGFIDASEMDPMLYESPYFIGPDGAVAAKTYALFREALKESGKIGIGKVVLRDREDMVALSPHDGCLILYRLRYPNEVRSTEDVPEVEAGAAVNDEQLKLARSLLDSMTKPMEEIELRDSYAEAVREIIDAKIRGQEVVAVGEEPRPVVDIMKALKQSIEQAKGQRQQMIRATGKPAEKKISKGRKRA